MLFEQRKEVRGRERERVAESAIATATQRWMDSRNGNGCLPSPEDWNSLHTQTYIFYSVETIFRCTFCLRTQSFFQDSTSLYFTVSRSLWIIQFSRNSNDVIRLSFRPAFVRRVQGTRTMYRTQHCHIARLVDLVWILSATQHKFKFHIENVCVVSRAK